MLPFISRLPSRFMNHAAFRTALVLQAVLLAGCAANTVTQGPVQGPVPVPKAKSSRSAPEAPPVRERRPPAPATPAPTEPRAQETENLTTETALLQSTLWVQTSEEYRGSTLQAYRLARKNLEAALADETWNAFPAVVSDDTATKTPAIILDVDETVLDNSPFEARRILKGSPFSRDTWYAWCRESAAEAIPGALELTQYANSRGVAVFYVTNRDHVLEEATRANLERLGFPLGDDGEDRIFTRGERPEWTSEKEPRRQEVAQDHRILLLLGDDLGDFVAGARSGLTERAEIFERNQARWGRQWILLPNPSYGSWERALYLGKDGLSEEDKLQIKLEALDPKTGGAQR